MEGLTILLIPRDKQKSEYDWLDIEFMDCRVGKARCLIEGETFTIFTITIYPEYQSHGYGREFVEYIKRQYTKVIADSVRFKAIGFWENVGFIRDRETNNWIYISPTI